MGFVGHILKVMDDKAVVINYEGEFIYIKKGQGMYAGQVIQYNKNDIYKTRKSFDKVISFGGMVAVLVFVFVYSKFLYTNGTRFNGQVDKNSEHISGYLGENGDSLGQSSITPVVTPDLPVLDWVPEGWENDNLNGWIGTNPKVTTEWAANGKYSMKDTINVDQEQLATTNNFVIIEKFSNLNFTGKKRIKAQLKAVGENIYVYPNIVKAASFIKSGDDWKWYASEYFTLNQNNTTEIVLELDKAGNIDYVRSIGYHIWIPPTAKGDVSVYIDNVVVE